MVLIVSGFAVSPLFGQQEGKFKVTV